MSNLNTIHIADIHFGKKNDVKLFKMLNNNFINKIKNEINNERKIHVIFINGDLFDRIIKMNEPAARLSFEFINNLINFANENGTLIRLLKGTNGHDFNQLNVFKSLEIENSSFKIVETASSERLTVDGENYDVLYLPEEQAKDYDEKYSSFFDRTYDMIVGHGMLKFVAFTDDDDYDDTKYTEMVHDEKNLMRICNGPIVFGHIHDMHEYRDKVFYTGSFERFSFADEEDKGFIFTSYDKSKKHTDVEFYINEDASTYYELDMELECSNFNIEQTVAYINDIKTKYDFVKIRTTNSNNAEVIRNILNASDNNVKMELSNPVKEKKVDEKYDFILNRTMDLPNTIKKFLKIEKDIDINIDIIKKIISTD